jgi:hypothetical protein
MSRAFGYAVMVGERDTREWHTVTCAHCQNVRLFESGKDPSDLGGFCRLCMKHICGPCADKGTCTPWEKKMEEAEARYRFLVSAGLS